MKFHTLFSIQISQNQNKRPYHTNYIYTAINISIINLKTRTKTRWKWTKTKRKYYQNILFIVSDRQKHYHIIMIIVSDITKDPLYSFSYFSGLLALAWAFFFTGALRCARNDLSAYAYTTHTTKWNVKYIIASINHINTVIRNIKNLKQISWREEKTENKREKNCPKMK